MADSIKRWYKNRFSKLKVIAPQSVWENVRVELNPPEAFWYRKSAREVEHVTPQNNTWEGLSVQLAYLNEMKRSARRFVYRTAGVMVVFALIPLSLVNNLDFTTKSFEPLIPIAVIGDFPVVIDSEEPDEVGVDPAILVETQNFDLPDQQRVLPSELPNWAEAEALIEPMPINQISIGTPREVVIPVSRGIMEPVLPKRKIASSQGFFIGPKTVLQFTSFLNPISTQAVKDNNPLINKIDANISYGIQADWHFNRLNGIGAGFMFNDQRNQRVNDIVNGEYTSQRLDMTFISLDMFYKRLLPLPSRNNPGGEAFAIVAGGFVAYRTQSALDFYHAQFDQTDFKSVDAGFKFELEYGKILSPHWRVSTAMTYKIGAVNLFKGTEKVPEDFYRTHSNSYGGTLGVQYRF